MMLKGNLLTKEKEVQAIIVNIKKEGLIAQSERERFIIPKDEITMYEKEKAKKLLGKKVNAVKISKKNLSRKKFQKKQYQKTKIGDIVEAKIIAFTPYGVIVKFGEGLIGKMYINDLTSAKLEKPSDLYKKGQKISCKIIKKQQDGKFLLSRIALYDEEQLKIEKGDILNCRITKKLDEKDGYFVEVIANPSYSGIFDLNKKNENNTYRIGQEIKLKVLELKDGKKLKLTTKID